MGVQLCWNSETAAVPQQKSRSSFCRSAIGPNRSRINCVGLQAAPWSTDIETQVQGLNKQLLHQVGLACPVSPAVPKKRCLNGEVWTARDRARNRSRFLFHLWKHPSTDRYAAYECTTLCSMLRLNCQYLHHARKLRSMLRQSKIQALSTLRLMLFLTQHLQGKFCIASNLFWIKIKRACLPDSHKKSTELNGTQICPSFCKLRFGTLTVPIQELPNLVELETAFHRASIGKAVGGDGIPPELCKYKARDLARLSYSIMLKTCLCSST